MTLESSRISLCVLSGIRTAQPQCCNGTNCHPSYRVSYLQFALSWFRFAKVHYFNIKQHWKIPLTAGERVAVKNSEKKPLSMDCLWKSARRISCVGTGICVCAHSFFWCFFSRKQILQTLRHPCFCCIGVARTLGKFFCWDMGHPSSVRDNYFMLLQRTNL